MRRIAAVILVLALASQVMGQANQIKNLLSIPADVTFLDKKTQKPVTLSGDLVFDSWPTLSPDGKEGSIAKDKLVPSNINPANMTRGEDGLFVVHTQMGQAKVKFPFKLIPVRLSDSKDISAAIERGFTPDTARDLTGQAAPEPPPVVLALDKKPMIDEIDVEQIQKIQFKKIEKVNMSVGGRYLAISKKLKGSEGAVQVEAATFFGGPEADSFIGGGFASDGSILGAMGVTDLGFAGSAPQTVFGKDPAKLPEPGPIGPPIGKGKLTLDRRNTVAIAQFGPDLKSLKRIVRLPWGSAWVQRFMISPSGAVYLSGTPMANFECLRDNVAKLHVVPNPGAPPAAKGPPTGLSDDSFLVRISADLRTIEWLIVFKQTGIEFGFQPGERALVWCGPKRYMIVDPAGNVSDGPTIKENIRENRWRFVVNPVDGSFYHGGDYQSGTGFEPYRNPWLHRIDPDGKCRWTAWNWSGPMVGTYFRQVSDSSVVKVKFARNGDLMVIGWSDGGNSVLCNPPYDLERTHGKYGVLHDMSAAGVGSFCHLLRMDARTMEIKPSTMWISYLPYAGQDKPNSAACRDIVELEDGRWAMAGGSAFAMIETPDAWIKSFMKEYEENPDTAIPKAGPCFVVFDPDMRTILFSSITPGVTNQQLATRGTKVLVIGSGAPKSVLYSRTEPAITVSPVQKEFGGGATDGYLMLIETAAKR